ncbi:terminase family protein (plasmid) [Azospirillum sp. HJ39]|uniref:terminase large subunit domain-containing protein n=1 Tax=Azospirillum sp. HJ39 TaxID=3159496 RepID=UPI003558C3A9
MTDAPEPRIEARALYWQGHGVAEIARRLGMAYGTVDAWKRRDGWDDAPIVARIDAHVEMRLMQLIALPEKSDRDLAEIDQISKVLERTARIKAFEVTRKELDLNPNIEKRNAGKKKKAKDEKNVLTPEQVQDLIDAFDYGLYEYQRRWLRAKGQYRVRNIQKSRQIGATWYFAREALIDAITSGDNQIFLSASKAQAHVFRSYIVQFVLDVTGVELKGSPITLWNGATLYFLGTNSKTAQSYHGHVYLDEYAWISKFLEFRKVASAMATHKKWRLTYFSTPSTIGHQSYEFWSGATFNKGRARADQVDFDVSHQALRAGLVGPDGQWRHMVTIHDAAAGGCDLFDIAQLLREYNEQDFRNLFGCEWVDDAQSFFTFAELQACMVDSWDVWGDFTPGDARPLGERPVWIGYDPSRSRDNASVVVISPPGGNQVKYRLVEKLTFTGSDFQAQAEAIRKLTLKYRVEHIGIDVTGMGQGVFEMVKVFYPAARAITYSVEVKSRMVLKAKHLISRKLVEFDSGWTDVISAFLSIRKTMTASGRQQTFAASRSDETGHADAAWAAMHALDRVHFDQFDTDTAPAQRRGFMEIFG